MAEEVLAQRVYDINIRGIQSSIEDMDKLIAKIKEADETKLKFNQTLAQAVSAGDKGAVDELTGKIKALEAEIEGLRNKESALRKEVDLLNSAQKINKAVTDDSAKSTTAAGNAASTAATKFQTLEQRIAAISKLRQQASIGTGLADFEGKTLNVDQLIKREQELTVELNLHKSIREATKGVIDQENIADTKSVRLLQQKVALLRTAIQNAPKGASVITFQGNNLEIANAQRQLQIYDLQVKATTGSQAVLNENLSVTGGSMRDLANQTLLLSEAAKQLTVSEKDVTLGLSNEQWKQYQSILGQIVPELENVSTAQANAGRAGEILQIQTAKNSQAILEFNRTISGRNTVVGDYTKGIVDAFKELNLGGVLQKEKIDIDIQIKEIIARIGALQAKWASSTNIQSADAENLKTELRQLASEYIVLKGKSEQLGQAFTQTGGIGSQVTGSIAAGFKNLDRTISQTLFTYLGFQAAIAAVTSIIRVDKQVSDQFSDLQRVLSATKEEMDGLISSIRELDTRTSLPDLFSFALIAARAGVATKDIAGVTQAIDRLHVVAGDSIGNIEQATTNIVKMINVFEGTGKVTEESVTRIGNALIQLESSGVATTEFLVNFTDRMAGVEGISKIGIKSVLGLAAAFEETGATAEVSASAISQILLRINNDIAKYAALAHGITDPLKIPPETIESFRQLVRENPGQALIQLAVGLRNNKQYLDEFSEGLGGLSARGVRITSVFGLLGANAEHFTQRIQDATAAIDGSSTIIDQYRLKQENLASTLDNIGKEFQKAFSSPKVLSALNEIGGAVLLFVRALTAIPFAVVITGLGLLAAGWAFYKGQVITTTLVQQLNNRQTVLGNIARVAERLGLLGSAAAMKEKSVQTGLATTQLKLFTAAEGEATAGMTAFDVAVDANPLGVILGVIALAIPLMGLLADETSKSASSLEKLGNASVEAGDKLKTMREEFIKNSQSANTLLPKYNQLTRDLGLLNKDTKTFKDTQSELNDVTQDLAKAFPFAIDGYTTTGEVAAIAAGQVTDFVNASRDALNIQTTIKINADRATLAEEQKLQQQRDELFRKAREGTLTIRKSIGVEQSITPGGPGREVFGDVKATQKEIEDAINDRNEGVKRIGALQAEINENQRKIDEGIKVESTLITKGNADQKLTLEQWKEQLKKVQDEINVIIALDGGRQKYKADLDRLLTREQEIKDTIQRLGGTSEKVSLNNVRFQRDELSEIEAIRSRELAIENTRFANVQEQRKRILAIEKDYFVDIKVIHQLTLGEQIDHIKNMQAIEDAANGQRLVKLKELHAQTLQLEKGQSGEELAKLQSQAVEQEKLIAETENKIAQGRVDKNKRIQDLIEADFREQTRIEKKALQARIAELETTFQALVQVQNIPFIVVAEAQKKLHDEEFRATIESYDKQIKLGKAQGANVEALQDDENKALQEVIQKGLEDARNIYDSYFKDIEKKFDDQLAHQNERLNQVRNQILNSNASQLQKQNLLDVSDRVEKINTATNEFNKASAIYAQKLIDFNIGVNKVTEAELKGFHDNVIKSKREIQEAIDELNAGINKFGNVREVLTSAFGHLLSGVFKAKPIDLTKPLEDQLKGLARTAELQKLLGETISDSFATAGQAMNDYFDAEKNRIEASKAAILDRMAVEEEQLKNRAQNQAEADSIDREFAQKRKDVERKAFEDNKKIQLAQAKINLAMQLSNIGVLAFANTPLNIATLGVAGAVMYAIQSALALVRYFSTVSQIQSAQFTGARGLVATESMSERGGVNKGRPHSEGGNKFLFRGTVYEDQIKEIRVIRTENAPSGGKYKIEGTQEQIASAINVIGGGINFTPGANIYKLALGGILNPDSLSFSLRAPSNPSVFLSGNKESNNAELRAAIVDIANATQAIGKKVDQTSDNVDTLAWQTNTRIDQIQVHVSTREIRRVDNKDQKATSIGTL